MRTKDKAYEKYLILNLGFCEALRRFTKVKTRDLIEPKKEANLPLEKNS